MILLLLACTPSPTGPWTPDRALAPTLTRLDTDKDGNVSEAEWARVDHLGPTFAEADVDKDGQLDLDELKKITFSQDPLEYSNRATTGATGLQGPGAREGKAPGGEGAREGKAPGGEGGREGKAPGGGGPADRLRPPQTLLVLQVLYEEVAAAKPDAPLPSRERVEAIGWTGTLDSPEAAALLQELEAAYTAAGMKFPERVKPGAE